jgi:hypothetical protein
LPQNKKKYQELQIYQELRMGIQKAEEAINNSIGCKLHNNNKFIMYFIVAEGLSLS